MSFTRVSYISDLEFKRCHKNLPDSHIFIRVFSFSFFFFLDLLIKMSSWGTEPDRPIGEALAYWLGENFRWLPQSKFVKNFGAEMILRNSLLQNALARRKRKRMVDRCLKSHTPGKSKITFFYYIILDCRKFNL